MKRLLIYYNFVVVSLMVVIGFLAAKTPIQIITAGLFFPLFVYFGFKVLPRPSKAIILPTRPEVKPIKTKKGKLSGEKAEVIKLKKEGVDVDRRVFLKAIASAGLSVFLFAIFTKKAEAAFFGSVPGPGTVSLKDSAGNKIDPAEKQPTDGYKITDIDDSTPAYYGFVDKDGKWFIQKEGATGDYRYVRGTSNYTTSWTNRAGLTYGYFDNTF